MGRKKMCVVAAGMLLAVLLCGFASREWTERQQVAHQIAELARSIGLPEDDAIIVRASEIWWEEDARVVGDADPYKEAEGRNAGDGVPYAGEAEAWYTQTDIDIVACVVYNEAGYGTTDRHKELVAAVVVNRVNDPRFPGSVYGVVTQPYQYSVSYATYGSYYMTRAMQSDIWEHCCEIAERALRGEVECPGGVVFQANFPQGTGTYELGYTSYSVTYFCYG